MSKSQSLNFKWMKVVFTNRKKQTFTLTYKIRKTRMAQVWAHCLKNSQTGKFLENNRFYNFPGQKLYSLGNLLKRLERNIQELKKLHPELKFPELDKNNIQTSINELHYDFAHGHHVTQVMNKQNANAWREFNMVLHGIEACLGNEHILKIKGIPQAHAIFTWRDPHRVFIPHDGYNEFTLREEFGVAYAAYSQVGRHILEMFLSQDDKLSDEHIQPHRLISGNTQLWFGPTTTAEEVERILSNMEKWFQKRKRRFHSLGLRWGDPELAIGQIPVADLKDRPKSKKAQLALIHKLSKFDRIKKVQVS